LRPLSYHTPPPFASKNKLKTARVSLTERAEGGILMGTVIGQWFKQVVNIVYPLSCLICEAALTPLSDKPLCESCWGKIELNPPPFCRVCGKHLPAKNQSQAFICRDCQSFPYFFKKARSACLYDGIIKECIHLFKYKGKLSLAGPLSRLMAEAADKLLDMKNVDLILPVPLHSVKQRQRQFNQAQLLAQSLAKSFSKELKEKLLVKTKAGTAQVKLSRNDRAKNVRGTFKVKKARLLENKNILLVDDVLTTHATVNECSRILLKAGAKSVEVFTLARSG
jgi:ComF family protein